jgi:FixJ family two-component response regulator
MNDFLAKPVHANVLAAVIDKWTSGLRPPVDAPAAQPQMHARR